MSRPNGIVRSIAELTLGMIASHKAPVELSPIASLALMGDEPSHRFLIQQAFRNSELSATHVQESIARRWGMGPQIPPDLTTRIALFRTREIALDEIHDIKGAEAAIFEGMEYARGARSDGTHGNELIDEVRLQLAVRVVRACIQGLKHQGSALVIPASPSATAYEAILAAGGADASAIDAWRPSPFWLSLAAAFGAAFLASGTIAGAPCDIIRQREGEIAARRRWREELEILEGGPAQVARAIEALYKERGGFDDLRAQAELARAWPESATSIADTAKLAALLVWDADRFHSRDPMMEGTRFLQLLTPCASPMTAEAAIALLRQEGIPLDAAYVVRGRRMIAWHADDAHVLAAKLAWHIRHNKAYATLEQLLEKKYKVEVQHFQQRLEQLHAAGADLSPIVDAVREKFPQDAAIVERFSHAVAVAERDAVPVEELPETEAYALEIPSPANETEPPPPLNAMEPMATMEQSGQLMLPIFAVSKAVGR